MLKIVITREYSQGLKFVSHFKDTGVETVVLPLINFKRFQASNERSTLQELHQNRFKTVIFTSPNGVKFLAQALDQNDQSRTLPGIKVLQGPQTLQTYQQLFNAAPGQLLLPSTQTAEGIVQLLNEHRLIKEQNLIITARKGLETIYQSCQQIGGTPTKLSPYETTNHTPSPKEINEWIEILNSPDTLITFFSPSAVESFSALKDMLIQHFPTKEIEHLISELKFAAFGPTTANSLKEENLMPELIHNASSTESFAKELIENFSNKRSP